HSDTSPLLKKLSIRKKLNNVKKKTFKKETDGEARSDYYAELLADKLGDRKSLSYFRLACRWHSPERLLEKASAIVGDGGAKNPAAVFVNWLKGEHPQTPSLTPQNSPGRAERRETIPSSSQTTGAIVWPNKRYTRRAGLPTSE